MAKSIFYNAKTGQSELIEIGNIVNEPIVWHLDFPFRVVVASETWKEWLRMKRDHVDYMDITGEELYPNLLSLLSYVKAMPKKDTKREDKATYFYQTEIYPEHQAIIKQYGGFIESKP